MPHVMKRCEGGVGSSIEWEQMKCQKKEESGKENMLVSLYSCGAIWQTIKEVISLSQSQLKKLPLKLYKVGENEDAGNYLH